MQAEGNNKRQPSGAATNTAWATSADVAGTVADWLVSDRLMTPDIRRSFDADVQITVLREETITLPDDVHEVIADCPQQGWLREISMHVEDTLLVHALCFAPAATCERHPWLLSLGNEPLGGQLARLDNVSRLSKSYSNTQGLGAGVASQAGTGAWSRRSLFDIQGAPLVLVEHLSAALTSQPRLIRDEPGKD